MYRDLYSLVLNLNFLLISLHSFTYSPVYNQSPLVISSSGNLVMYLYLHIIPTTLLHVPRVEFRQMKKNFRDWSAFFPVEFHFLDF